MTDISNFVIRWEIDNVAAKHAAGKAESDVFDEGGFRWTAKAERRDDRVQFTLRFGVGNNRASKCAGTMAMIFGDEYEANIPIHKEFAFDGKSDTLCFDSTFYWDYFRSPKYDYTVDVEFHIDITYSNRDEVIAALSARFAAPDSRSNVVLKIGDEKLHVSKECLAVHSPVFEAMFFGNSAENGNEEVEIKDVIYEEFLDLLNLIYLVSVEITDRNVVHLLELAYQFQMKYVLELSVKYLMQSNGFDASHKLIMTEQYSLTEIRDHCLNSIKSLAEWYEDLQMSPEVDKFSDEMNSAILRRIMKLKLQ